MQIDEVSIPSQLKYVEVSKVLDGWLLYMYVRDLEG